MASPHPRRGPGPGRRGRAGRAARRRRRRGGQRRGRAGGAPPSRAPRPDARSRPRVPVVAVTGTNGKTTTTRMIAHIARTSGLLVGWSQHRRDLRRRRARRGRRLLRPERRRPGAGAPRGRARGHRDRPRRHPAQGHRPDPQRRLGRHQRHRRPPRPAGHRHRRPARRGEGRGPQDHPQGRLGGAERRRPAGLRDAGRDQGAALGVLPRPRLAGDPRDALSGGGRATTVIDGWVSVLAADARRRPADRAGRRPDDAGRPVPVQRREHPRRRLGGAGRRASRATWWSRGCARSGPTPSTTRAG